MSADFLIALSLLQAGLLVVVVTGLLIGHAASVRRQRRREGELAVVRDALRRFLSRTLLADEAILILDRISTGSLSAFLHEFSARTADHDSEAVFELLSRTRWHRRIMAHARSRFWWRRLGAARAIATIARVEHLMVVHELVNDEVPAIWLAAASALERLPSPALASAILDRAIAGHAVGRNHLIEVLAASRTMVLPVLIDRLRAPADDAELRALLDLGTLLGYPTLLPHVIPYAMSSNMEIRVATATCLRNFPHPQTTNALRRLLTDRSWQVRARAAASLGGVGAVEAIDDLLLSLCDPNWWVRLRSAIALRLIGPAGISALARVDREIDPYAFDMAHYVLELGDGAMAEYVGGSAGDFTAARSGALAS